MALNVPHTGENIALEALVNKTAPQNLVLKLYQNNIDPSDTDTAGTYTEATFGGYSAATLTGSSWGAASAGTITYGSQQTFTCNGSTPNSIYGYFVVQATSGTLVYSEKASGAPLSVTNNGDAVKITPTISAD